MLCPEHLWGCLQGRGAEEEASWTNNGSLSLTTRRVWNWGRSELRRRAQPGVRLAGGVQADPNVWRAGVACWRRALGTRYVRGGAVCGWLSLTTRRVWDWGRSELRRHAQPGVRLAGGVQADPNVWRAGVACWRRALGTRYVRGGAVCGWLSITGSLIGGGVNSERDTRTLAWRGGYGHPHPSVWQAPLRLWSRTTIRPLRRHTRLCHQLLEACSRP